MAVFQKKVMPNDFRLLFNAILSQSPSRFDTVTVPAKRMPSEGEEYPALMLPHMRHFVDEQSLFSNMLVTEIVAEQFALGMEMNVSARGHHNVFGLEPPPFMIAQSHMIILNRGSKNALGQSFFSRGQAAFAQC
jgi:hypothetical protein